MRNAEISRDTKETKISVKINLDGSGIAKLETGVPFLEHMLEQIAKHASIDLEISCDGDVHIDDHHSVEDIGIALGQAIAIALADKKGICRFGHAYIALDEALSRVVIDISGRPGLHFFADFTRDSIGRFDVQLVREFFQALTNHSLITLHIDNLRGINVHHQVESIFKAFAKALAMAITIDSKNPLSLPSTKGKL